MNGLTTSAYRRLCLCPGSFVTSTCTSLSGMKMRSTSRSMVRRGSSSIAYRSQLTALIMIASCRSGSRSGLRNAHACASRRTRSQFLTLENSYPASARRICCRPFHCSKRQRGSQQCSCSRETVRIDHSSRKQRDPLRTLCASSDSQACKICLGSTSHLTYMPIPPPMIHIP